MIGIIIFIIIVAAILGKSTKLIGNVKELIIGIIGIVFIIGIFSYILKFIGGIIQSVFYIPSLKFIYTFIIIYCICLLLYPVIYFIISCFYTYKEWSIDEAFNETIKNIGIGDIDDIIYSMSNNSELLSKNKYCKRILRNPEKAQDYILGRTLLVTGYKYEDIRYLGIIKNYEIISYGGSGIGKKPKKEILYIETEMANELMKEIENTFNDMGVVTDEKLYMELINKEIKNVIKKYSWIVQMYLKSKKAEAFIVDIPSNVAVPHFEKKLYCSVELTNVIENTFNDMAMATDKELYMQLCENKENKYSCVIKEYPWLVEFYLKTMAEQKKVNTVELSPDSDVSCFKNILYCSKTPNPNPSNMLPSVTMEIN